VKPTLAQRTLHRFRPDRRFHMQGAMTSARDPSARATRLGSAMRCRTRALWTCLGFELAPIAATR